MFFWAFDDSGDLDAWDIELAAEAGGQWDSNYGANFDLRFEPRGCWSATSGPDVPTRRGSCAREPLDAIGRILAAAPPPHHGLSGARLRACRLHH